MHATTLSSVALMFWKTLEQDYQLNSESLFREAGLDPSRIYDPNYRYFNVTYPLDELIRVPIYLHFQYFSGYAETLRAYYVHSEHVYLGFSAFK